ncbi:MAG: methionyl-tRNA formyltransferase [Alphaproteobacteria bacterium]|nr:MAG: methionyl-tRNA formyltransferase [Alphaproteobacteria bacterium]
MRGLRLAFFGTPDFAIPSLEALLEAGHKIVAVYTQPPRPAGRGQAPRKGAVHHMAEARGLPVRTPASLRDAATQAAFAALDLDAAVVAAYGLILPQAILDAPRLGCLNVHASLLPRWRGAAPIQRAILAGDRETGITIMQMDAGLDTGPILLQEAVPIGPRETAGELHDRLAALGGRLVVTALEELAAGRLAPRAQPADGVTHAPKITPAERRIDWHAPALSVDRQVRAFAPAPGAWSVWREERLVILSGQPAEGAGTPGTLLDDRLTIACGEGAFRITALKRAGRKALPVEAFLRGFSLPPGSRFD